MIYYDNDNKSKFKHFFKTKGLYIALFLCIAAVGAGTWGVVSKTMNTEDETEASTVFQTENVTNADWNNSDKQVNKVVANEQDTREDESEKEETEPATMASNNLNQPYESLYVFPVGEEIVKDYSSGELVYSKTMDDWRIHDGIDFKADEGTQVKAINDGIVLSICEDALWGTVMEIDHGSGLVARYCGLAKEANVKVGDSVAINSVIGAVSNIPCETAEGFHLHLEIEIGSTIVDPLEAMGKTGE